MKKKKNNPKKSPGSERQVVYRDLTCCTDNAYYSNEEVQTSVFAAIEHNFTGVCVPNNCLSNIKPIIPEGFVLSTPIDYPLGIASSKVRQHATLEAIKLGANAVDLVANFQFIKRKQAQKFMDDVEIHHNICKEHSASLRIMVDYRLVEIKFLYEICKSLRNLGIEYVFPTPGYHNDNFIDNLLVCQQLQAKTGLKAICNGPIYTNDHLDLVLETKILGYRLKSHKLFKRLCIT